MTRLDKPGASNPPLSSRRPAYSFFPAFGWVSSTFGIGAGIDSAGRGAACADAAQLLQPPQPPPPQKSSISLQQSQTPWVARQPITAARKPIAKSEKSERRMVWSLSIILETEWVKDPPPSAADLQFPLLANWVKGEQLEISGEFLLIIVPGRQVS